MGITNKQPPDQGTFYDISEWPLMGRLDETVDAEMMSDAAIIRTYIRAEATAAAAAPGRALPSIARQVLTSVWAVPRSGFHERALAGTGFQKSDFNNKMLLIPWSVEAFEQWKSNLSVTGLVLEHVTPIDWMWQELKKIHLDSYEPDGLRDDELWGTQAASFLIHHYMVAVLTVEQAKAVDATGLRKTGFPWNPYLRYREAERLMDLDRAQGKERPDFSVKRFVIPGPL